MTRHAKLKARLPRWNMLLLALILGGGGFFWFTSYRQQLLTQVDTQLVLTAEHIVQLYSGDRAENPRQQEPCNRLEDLRTVSTRFIQLGLYETTGKILCATDRHIFAPLLTDASPPPRTTPHPTFEARAEGNYRVLFFPLSLPSGPAQLVLKADLAQLQSRLTMFIVLGFPLGIGLLTGFAWLQRRIRGENSAVMADLGRIMEQTSAHIQPPPFTVDETAAPEARQLADRYNDLMNRMAEDLRRSRQFAADVTHELRTPLTILRGETELALRSDRDREQLRRVLESNLEEISRMSYLIEDLLLLSKSDLGEIPLKLERLHLSGLLTELHHQAQLLAEAKGITVTLHIPEQAIELQADSLRLRQVILNLLTNAIRYTPERGVVRLSLTEHREMIEITVADNGIGIDTADLEKIFERFYRVDKTRNRNDGGSGLGLAIVKWIVDAHGGQIKVSSVPGQGSCFSVFLPVQHKTQALPQTA